MKIVRTTFDRQEERRDRRYPVPPLFIRIAEAEYTTVNWSLGGFLINGFAEPVTIGAPVEGELRFMDQVAGLPFTARIVRLDKPEPGQLAVQFTDLGERGFELLDRIIARRLNHRR